MRGLQGVKVGDVISFDGEYLENPKYYEIEMPCGEFPPMVGDQRWIEERGNRMFECVAVGSYTAKWRMLRDTRVGSAE